MDDSLQLEFRKAAEADLEDIFRVFADAIAKMDDNGIPQWDEVYPDRSILLDDIAKNQLCVAVLDGEIVCAYAVNAECDEQYENGDWQYPDASFRVVHRLCVSPKAQSRGVGAAVCLHIAEGLVAEGIEAVRFDAFPQNPSALRLYEKLGCKKVGTANWRKGQFWLMEKKL